MKYLLFFVFVGFFVPSIGQIPHFDLLTKDNGLPSNQVYDIAEDKDGRIYIATNEGFVVYVSGKFISVPTESGEMPAGTGIKITHDNRVFCMSFDGRVFEIIGKELKLFYDISDDIKSYTSLFIKGNHLILTNENNIHFYSFRSKTWKVINTEKSLYFVSFEADKMQLNFKNTITSINLEKGYEVNNKINTPNHKITFTSNGCKIIQQNSPFKIFTEYRGSKKENSFLSKHLNWNGIYDLAFYKNYYLLGTKNGLFFLDEQMEIIHHLFSNIHIGKIFIDKSDQIWLTSPKKGLFVAKYPSFQIDASKNEFSIDRISGTNEELILQFGTTITSIKKEGKKFIFLPKNHELAHISPSEILISDRVGHIKNIEQKIIYPSLKLVKDTYKIDSSTNLYATRKNVVIIADSTFSNRYQTKKFSNSGKQLLELSNRRGLSTFYQEKSQNIFAGTVTDLIIYSPDKRVDTIRFNSRQIKALDIIESSNNEIWVGAVDGIYIFRNRNKVRHIPTQQKTFKLLSHNDVIYAISSSEIIAFNSKTRSSIYKLSKMDGLPSSEIEGATIFRDSLFVLTAKGLVQGSVSDLLNRKLVSPKILLTTTKNDNTPIKNFKDIDYGFSTLELNFEVIVPTSENQFTVLYRLSNKTPFNKLEKGSSTLRLNQLSYGEYNLEVKVIDAYGQQSKVIFIPFVVNPPFYRSNWFYLLILVIIIGIVSMVFAVRISVIRRRLTLEKKLKASEITAIKSQMNPHFIFNALNSIQDLILRKDVRSSNIYLGKFSQLVRKVLSFSEKTDISLEEEIEMLNLYLELEKLRFKDDFHYQIISTISDESKFNLPSLLLQPYIENAVKHGLLHKEGKKNLRIIFSENKDNYLCSIEDNGIGRKKSAKINQRRAKYNQSFSTSANEKRIKLINEVSEKKINLNVIDLENDKGTKVIFQFKK